jgi:hypothetical protein
MHRGLSPREHIMVQKEHCLKTYLVVSHGLAWVLLGLILFLCGCASGTSRKTSSMKSAKSVKSSAAEFSSRNQSLLALYSAEIETAADRIIFESPSVRRQALLWKAEAIPVLQTSLLNTDPVAAALDTWAFLFQMSAYMQQPVVKDGFGESHPIVVETLRKMETQMEQLVLTAAPTAKIPALRERVTSWAEAHPAQAGLASRQSIGPELIRRAGESELGRLASLKALSVGLGDFTARLDSYNAYLPKQARWQAELALIDLTTHNPEVTNAISSLGVLSNALAKSSSGMKRMPELLGQARATALADIEGQRVDAQAFFRAERLDTMETLKQERIATVAALDGERLAAVADLRKERQIVLDALHDERVAMTDDLHAASEKALRAFDANSRSLIDHFFLRAAELVLLTLALCFLAFWILLRRFTAKFMDRGRGWSDRAA